MINKYGHVVLNDKQVRWIIKVKDDGKLANREIAASQGISVSRVQQIYREYKKSGKIPELRKAGRPRKTIMEDERNTVIEMHKKYRLGAGYIGKVLRNMGISIGNDRINEVLKEAGFAVSEPRMWHRKKWIRYERDHSNSLWHVDWHEIKDTRWKGRLLIVYEDDSSRFIIGYGVYGTLTSKFSVDVLKEAIKNYGKPEQILSDHGTTFYAIETDEKEKGFTEFEKFLMKEKITFIVGRVDHPQRL
ncbi:MAG: DDE-type integrase/transposase/recombinase [Nitrososphaerota archaeon]|jgi:putative transposase|nr:DDE-type integrase/transposase/recombinase [Nitrososphaerota archaeon]